MELILRGIELNEVGINDDMLFNVHYDAKIKRFVATHIDSSLQLEYDLIGDAEQIAQEHREEILTYRLGRFTNEDVVDIGDIFMYGKFNRLVEHKTWEVKTSIVKMVDIENGGYKYFNLPDNVVSKPNTKDVKRMIIENFIDWFTRNEEEREQMKTDAMVYVDEDHVDEIAQAYNL